MQPTDLIGRDVYGHDHEKIGSVGQVYLADSTRKAEWATVRTGLFGMKESFVPLRGAQMESDALLLPIDKEQVKDAPRVDVDGRLTEAEAAQLYRYYGFTGQQPTDQPAGQQAGQKAGQKTGQQGGQEEIVRHEERMRVGTEQVETGTFRVRKYVVTEDQDVTVPLSHEEIRVERTPIKDGERTAGKGKISESDHEITLHAERPVVDTETVPVERVRVGTETVMDEQTVHGQVRKEKLELGEDPKHRK
jgi:uncharacterized protein (TIGR02271 family)